MPHFVGVDARGLPVGDCWAADKEMALAKLQWVHGERVDDVKDEADLAIDRHLERPFLDVALTGEDPEC